MKLFAKQSSSGDGRVFRSGVWSAAIAAAVIVLAVLVNLIVRAIPSRYTEFDLSEAGLYTLSESSRQVADDLTQDVTIYYLPRPAMRTRSSPSCWTSTPPRAAISPGS